MPLEKTLAIVTEVRKHSDRHNVVTLFTRERGRVAVLAPAGNGKSARLRNAALMPLSVVETHINFNNSRELQFLGRFQRAELWKDIYFDPVKSAVAMFVTEFVNYYIRNAGPEPALWDFVRNSIKTLDEARGSIANFHLAFLADFMFYAGIRPDLSEWREDAWFDMREGVMTIFTPSHRDALTPQQARFLPTLMRLNLRSAPKFRFNASQRRELLAGFLKYYALHFPGLNNLKSPEILSQLFS